MEIDNSVFQESFGKEKFFKIAMETCGFLFGKTLTCPKMDVA